MHTPHAPLAKAADVISTLGGVILRYGLCIPLAWIGLQKFTIQEAQAISLFINNQPLMSWLYNIFSLQGLSSALGTIEIAAAVLIASRPVSAWAAATGSAIAVFLFLSTLSFLFTTPGVVENSSVYVPLLTDTGGFLIKDIALLGAATWTLGEERCVPLGSVDRPGCRYRLCDRRRWSAARSISLECSAAPTTCGQRSHGTNEVVSGRHPGRGRGR